MIGMGCGGADVSREPARCVGAGGHVVGLDMDTTKLEIVCAEATAQNIAKVVRADQFIQAVPPCEDRQ